MNLKENLNKIWTLLSILMVIGFGYKLYESWTKNDILHKDLIGKTERLVKLSEHAAKLENKYVSQKKLLEETKKKFKKEVDSLQGRVKVLSNATFLIREKARETDSSDLSYQGKHMRYVLNEIRFNDGPPLGYVLIFDDGRVVSRIYNHMIDVNQLIARDEDSGRYEIIAKANYVLKSPSLNLNGEENWVNRPYPLDIHGGRAVVDPTEKSASNSKFHLWSPRYNLNVNFSKDLRTGLGVSFMGYGPNKRDLDWKFIQLGIESDFDREFDITFTPVLYRPFRETLPNTYLGAGVNSTKSIFLQLNLGF